jgi:hypothetical protein
MDTATEWTVWHRVERSARSRAPDVEVLSRDRLANVARWQTCLASCRKDHRYYEVVEDTIGQNFAYRYFAIRGDDGHVCAIVPFFIGDLDLGGGLTGWTARAVACVRRAWPTFLTTRALLIGCVAGDGQLDDADEMSHAAQVERLLPAITDCAADNRVRLIVFKEFPSRYRSALEPLLRDGYARVPSLPAVRLEIDYPNFEAFMTEALSCKTRKDLRRKFRLSSPIDLEVMHDVTPIVDQVYPLYLQVYHRAELHFERLTKEFFCQIGQRMPDRGRFFVWRHDGCVIAFSLCMVHGKEMSGEYLGLDYALALDWHLYHHVVCDVLNWAMVHGYKAFRSGSGNYDPKLHLRFRLDPLDLYVRHTSPIVNVAFAKLITVLAPTRSDPILRKFENWSDL